MTDVARARLRKFGFLQLAVMLVLVLLLVPLLLEHQVLGVLTELVMLDSLVVAAGTSRLGRRMRWPLLTAWLLSMAAFVAGYLGWWPDQEHLAFLLSAFCYTLYALGCTVAVLAFVAENRQGVTLDSLLAAVAAYVLLAISFSCVFSLLGMLNADSFHPATVVSHAHPAHVYLTMIYFSLVTLTTVGYGDITPVGGYAQMFSGVEALIGQLYLAILVAYLVGSHLSARLVGGPKRPQGQ